MTVSRHYSGVVVTTEPARLDEAWAAMTALEGVGVHHRDPTSGRCVVVLESDDRSSQERLFRAIRELPGVRAVDLVYHLVDPESVSRLVLEEPTP